MILCSRLTCRLPSLDDIDLAGGESEKPIDQSTWIRRIDGTAENIFYNVLVLRLRTEVRRRSALSLSFDTLLPV